MYLYRYRYKNMYVYRYRQIDRSIRTSVYASREENALDSSASTVLMIWRGMEREEKESEKFVCVYICLYVPIHIYTYR